MTRSQPLDILQFWRVSSGAVSAMGKGRFSELGIVVVNFRSTGLLEANVAPLARALPGARVVVVDNLSDAAERDRVGRVARAEGWELVGPPRNLGFGRGMNAGVARAAGLGASVFLLLNPDAVIDAPAVESLLGVVEGDPLALVAPRILRPDGSVWFDGADVHLADGRITSARRRAEFETADLEPWLSGACLMVSHTLWDRVGGFGRGYFLYWEDVELSYRVRRAGGRLVVRSDVSALHAEGGTQGQGLQARGAPKSGLYYYFNIRNRLVFAARNLDRETVARWRRASIPIAYEVLLQGGRRQLLRSWTPVRAAVRGVRDGLRASRD